MFILQIIKYIVGIPVLTAGAERGVFYIAQDIFFEYAVVVIDIRIIYVMKNLTYRRYTVKNSQQPRTNATDRLQAILEGLLEGLLEEPLEKLLQARYSQKVQHQGSQVTGGKPNLISVDMLSMRSICEIEGSRRFVLREPFFQAPRQRKKDDHSFPDEADQFSSNRSLATLPCFPFMVILISRSKFISGLFFLNFYRERYYKFSSIH